MKAKCRSVVNLWLNFTFPFNEKLIDYQNDVIKWTEFTELTPPIVYYYSSLDYKICIYIYMFPLEIVQWTRRSWITGKIATHQYMYVTCFMPQNTCDFLHKFCIFSWIRIMQISFLTPTVKKCSHVQDRLMTKYYYMVFVYRVYKYYCYTIYGYATLWSAMLALFCLITTIKLYHNITDQWT